MSDLNNPERDSDLTAAELAFGLLDTEAAREALRLQADDRRFADEVRRWQAVADDWLERLDNKDAVPDLLPQIEKQLDASQRPADLFAGSMRSPWKTWALTSLAATVILTIALAFTLAVRDRPVAKAPVQFAANVTQISDAEGTPLLSAVYERDKGTLTLRVAKLAKGGKVPELWVIPEGGKPRSLGLLGSDKIAVEISPDLRALLVEGASLAITLEPNTGARHAAPSGTIIGTAKLQSI